MNRHIIKKRLRGMDRMNGKVKILIIEDDKETRDELVTWLAGAGYEAASVEAAEKPAQDAEGLARAALEKSPDLILLDVNLPGVSGLKVCEKIRETSDVPVIFVTGNNTPMDELNGILRGGDDYVTKPYQLPVLTARIGAVLRRTLGRGQERESSARQEYRGVVLDTAAARISKGEKSCELTKNELKILYCLFRHPGEIVSRADMIDYLWDNEVFIDDNTLSVNITRIRSKLKEIGAENFIETKRGMGYRI